MYDKIISFCKNRNNAAAVIFMIVAVACFVVEWPDSLTLIKSQHNWVTESDNLIFPVYHLDNMVFPFQKLFQNILFLHLPDFLSFFKTVIVFSPVFLAMSAGLAHSVYAGIFSAFFVFILLHIDLSSNRSLEQIVISSCALAATASFFCFRERPAVRYTVLSLSLAALSQSKGVCFPLVFLFVLFEALCRKSENKTVWPALFIALLFIVAGAAWNIVASAENPDNSVFFTESGGRLIPNLIAGAYGLAGTTEGRTAQAMGTSGVFESFRVATVMVFSHPVAYIGSIFERFLILSKESWYVSPLVIMWAVSFAVLRRRRELLIIPLCAAYFFIIYMLMPVEKRYFVPAWFLMCVSSAMALSDILSCTKAFQSPKYVMSVLDIVFFSPYLLVWFASIVLLITFPARRKSFDIDKALSLFPENRYMLSVPLRQSYPDIWDFKDRAEFFKKNVNDELQMYKLRWFEYFLHTQHDKEADEQNKSAGNKTAQDIPQEYNIARTKKAISWPDILLESIKYYKKNDYINADRLAGAAALSCMLSSGYIRTNRGDDNSYTVHEKEYADKLALASAGDCANNMSNMFLIIPPWEYRLKETMMNNGFGRYLSANGLSDLYNERKMNTCSECCVPDGFLKSPAKCGFGGIGLMDAYECFDEYICRGYIWCREQTDATEQEKNFCKRLGRKVNEDDIDLVKKYPVLNESNVYRTVAAACYTVAFSYMRDGDRINAALWLHRAMQMNPDIIYEKNFEKIRNFIMGGTASF